VIPVHLPPLRERPGDIPLLAGHLIARNARTVGKHIKGIEPEALEALTKYEWPGNVRELDNTIQRAMTLAAGETITLDDIVLGGGAKSAARPLVGAGVHVPEDPTGEVNLEQELRTVERKLILDALERTNWNQKEAADLLNTGYRQLRYRINKLNLKEERER
jgi:transcriptional regulator with GAF, ATPase, and Fis domain